MMIISKIIQGYDNLKKKKNMRFDDYNNYIKV